MHRALFLPLLVVTSAAEAQLHTGDLILGVADNHVLVSRALTDGSTEPFRVFADRFGKLGPSLPNRTPDPGFNAIPGQFISGQAVGITIRRAARKWTPDPLDSSRGDFCTIPEERIEIRKSTAIITTPLTDPADLLGPSVELGVTDPVDGQFHEHGVFWLTTPFNAGVYLVELSIWVIDPPPASVSIAPSDPVWLVFNQNRPQAEVEAAVNWLIASVASVPGTGGSLCPPPPCPCDFNGQSGLTVQDIFDFLAAYFAGAADFNNDSITSVQDIFDFLSCYFSGC